MSAEQQSESMRTVKLLQECFRTRDNETPFEIYDPKIEVDFTRSPIPDAQQVYRGHDGIRELWRTWLAPWDAIEFETSEFAEPGAGEVLSFIKQRNRGRETGIWVEMPPYAHYWKFRDGKAVAWVYYPEDEARREFDL